MITPAQIKAFEEENATTVDIHAQQAASRRLAEKLRDEEPPTELDDTERLHS